MNQPQVQGQGVPGAVPVQAQVVYGVVLGQHLPQAQGQDIPIVPAPGQVAPGVLPGQLKLQAQGQVVRIIRRQDMSLTISFCVNINRKPKDKLFLWFRR